MSKFNTGAPTASRQTRATSPVKTKYDESTLRTGNDAPAWERKPKGELFMLAITSMVGEDSFYEGKSERDERFRDLVRKVSEKDPEWMARFIPWLRNEANMRTASIVAAVEFAQAAKGLTGDVTARKVVNSAISRADEPGEVLAYVASRGYELSKPIKRGVADAVTRLFTERNVLKYDGDSHDWRFGDVLEVTHASPRGDAAWQGDLFEYVISKRHKRADLTIPESLQMLQAHARLAEMPVESRRKLLEHAPDGISNVLGNAGMTWESLSGWLQGPMDAAAWEAIIPSMGYMALLRNLRNFDQAGVSDEVARTVAAKLSTPLEVAKSRQLPMRFLSAYNAAPSLRWAWALEQALQMSLENVPELGGRTLIMIDTSGSMNDGFSRDGSLKRWDAAAMFGLALAMRAAHADVVSYSTSTRAFPLDKAASLLKQLELFRTSYFLNHGTATAQSLKQCFAGHDRVVILTDEQADSWGYGAGYRNEVAERSVSNAIPASVPMFSFNLAGYKAAHAPSGTNNRHSIGGLTDHGFKLIELVERGVSGSWPF